LIKLSKRNFIKKIVCTQSFFQQFRETLYQILPNRADAVLDFIDALNVAGHVASPVALSEKVSFRRKFSSIYDVLSEGRLEAVESPEE